MTSYVLEVRIKRNEKISYGEIEGCFVHSGHRSSHSWQVPLGALLMQATSCSIGGSGMKCGVNENDTYGGSVEV